MFRSNDRTIFRMSNNFLNGKYEDNVRGVIKKTTVNAAAECDPAERQRSSIREAARRTLVTVCDKFQLFGAVSRL